MKLIVRTCIAAAALVPMLASALPPGQYDITGKQQICLLDNGTWYGVTFGGWGGHYKVKSSKTFIYGNYADGVGNDSMVFFENDKGSWTEWRDDFSHETVTRDHIRMVKSECDPPAAAAQGGPMNPQER
jgi:hypothetical protein